MSTEAAPALFISISSFIVGVLTPKISDRR
jgi:hypothetical protein